MPSRDHRRHPRGQEGACWPDRWRARERAVLERTAARPPAARAVIGPELAVADGALGFWQAVEEVWPKTRSQRCWVHTIRTQSPDGLPGTVVTGLRRWTQGDDMADLKATVAHDDALDDKLQDRLLVGERRPVQARVDAIA